MLPLAVAVHSVAEVLLQEDLHQAQAVASQSWLRWGSQVVAAYGNYWGVESRLVAFHAWTWWQQQAQYWGLAPAKS